MLPYGMLQFGTILPCVAVLVLLQTQALHVQSGGLDVSFRTGCDCDCV